ncbi:hypothetical protein K2X14_07755 [Acetobacter sp. TBRC 12305]|uniref:Terminase small subunit n=1 Tax=Acetobacter garciniae TaxID=2817435 RepID=A0A939KRK7_9PROT|nr:hypothetical protein [Acetobacter garciniae]MBO1325301.1 hypothetical protein [Acetobacter garciniae]MBX0344727.1 hypothetical protein [Acetobacter garciniae]
MTTISQSEAARRAGLSRAAIQKNIATGKIKADNGKVDLASFDEWLALRQEMQPDLQPVAPQVATGGRAVADAGDHGPSNRDEQIPLEAMSRAEAARLREVYKAQTARLEYDQKASRVVEVELIARAVGDEYARVRASLLAIPAEHAPTLARCKGAAELRERLETLIAHALEKLTLDGEDAASRLQGRV